MFKKMAITCLLTPSLVLAAAPVGTGTTQISSVNSYNQWHGDVTFKVADPIAECSSGYWIRKDDLGFNANLSLILSAYQAKNAVVVYGLADQLWDGTTNKVCKLYNIKLN